MIEVFTSDLALIIITATLLAFLARKTGQPTIIGYIVAGLLLGPGLSLISETEMTRLFSELGLVLLLFLIGLEMELEEIEDILRPVTVIGAVQMALFFCVGLGLSSVLGFSLVESVFIGAAVMFSSTALVVKLLTDEGQISEMSGRLDVGILLVQDVVVVVIMALISSGLGSPSQVIFRFFEVMLLISMISVISILLSRRGLSRVLGRISGDQHTLLIFGLAWAFLFISTAEILNISTEIGAFVAGVGLAQLPYSFEVQERVRPMTDLFMAIFFINFGLTIVPEHLTAYIPEALAFSIVIIPLKAVAFFIIIDRLGYSLETSFIGGINMTQTSEFSIILASLAISTGLIGESILGFIGLVALISMGASSYLIKYNEEILEKLRPYLQRFETEKVQDSFESSREGHVAILGYDEMARNTVEELDDFYDDIVIVDRKPENIEQLNEISHEYIYGDIRHGKVRRDSGLENAEMVISFIPEFNLNKQILRACGEDATKIVKASNFEEASELYDMDAHYVIIKNMLSGDRLGKQLKVYLEDRKLFDEEVKEEKRKIDWRSRTWR
ncbi:MAG: cation:proton antiporter [Candidatus Nanohaloarchaea archaeon]